MRLGRAGGLTALALAGAAGAACVYFGGGLLRSIPEPKPAIEGARQPRVPAEPEAVAAAFWLSGYNAVATAAGETMTFSSERPSTFDTIEIEVLRQPSGGAIDVRLDGVIETSYDLKSSKLEPVVIRLQPARAATEKVREISITTKGQGVVSLASVAIYNRQSGLTYNSVGYVGAQVSLLNKFNSKLFANDLIRINPHIVVLSFGTNEASKESLDLAEYAKSYERVVSKIKSILTRAAIVVIS